MCAPSEYWATWSGIAIESMRDNTHPALPSLVRTRYQSSILTGTGGGGGNFACSFFFSSALKLLLGGFDDLRKLQPVRGRFRRRRLADRQQAFLPGIGLLLWLLFWCGFHDRRRRCDPRRKSSSDHVELGCPD